MDATSAGSVLKDVEDIRRRTRQDRRATSVPLLTFGALGIGGAFVRIVAGPAEALYWALAAPVGFAVTAWVLRRHEVGSGVGTRSSSYRRWALGVLVTLLLLPFLVLFGMPLALIGLGLLTIAVRQRNPYLAVTAGVFAVVGVLDGLLFIENRIYDLNQWLGAYESTSGYASWASKVSGALPAAVLLVAGLTARRRERSAR
jgi:hypothetical protein